MLTALGKGSLRPLDGNYSRSLGWESGVVEFSGILVCQIAYIYRVSSSLSEVVLQ